MQAEYRWNRADYSMPSFEKKYTDWLAEQVSIPAPHNQGKSKAQEGANPSPLGRGSEEAGHVMNSSDLVMKY